MSGDGELLEAARGGDEEAFRALAEPHRHALLAHCYRMSGSLQQAEELVQEAMIRAWRGLSSFEERASFKNWLYRIATNVTLDALKRAKARVLPTSQAGPSAPDAPLPRPVAEPVWLEPYPDSLLPEDERAVPADDVLSQRQSVAFAFLQALQRLPPSQRAALLLKDVVGSSSAEVAELLDTTATAVNSMLQRARTTLGTAPPPEEADDAELAVVRTYVQAFESASVDSLVDLLREDARLSMPPVPSWYSGPEAIAGFLRRVVLTPEAQGRFRALPTRSNRRPAVALYERQPDGAYTLLGVHVLDVVDGAVADIVAFMDPGVLRFFDLPPSLPA
jgi:RNA polymerase sigma-70 factor (ECF subfamily)